MKRNLVILTLIGLLLTPTILLAAIIPDPGADYETGNGDAPITTLTDITDLLKEVGKWISAIVMALAVVFILVSAFQFLTSAGNPEKITSARNMLIYALVAVAIAVVAWGLPELIESLVS